MYAYRIATKEDLKPIIELSKQQHYDETRSNYILNIINEGVFTVATKSTDIIGFRYGKRFEEDIFNTQNFLIHEKYRGQGIGTELSAFMFRLLKEQGYKIDILSNSDYYPPVKGAVKNGKWLRPTNFYKRLGYKLVAQTDKTRIFIIDFNEIDWFYSK